MKKILILHLILCHFAGFTQDDTLDIASWNVFLRPSILNDGQMDRVESIAAYMESSNADVLVLQEVFHRRARKRMVKNLSKNYPHHTSVGPTTIWGVNSGVMIFSKRKIDDEKRISFKGGIGSDRMARKGAVAATLHIRHHKIHIIGTHMQAGGGKKREEVRKRQLRRIKKLTEQLDSSGIFIFAGDFNIRKDSRMFQSLQDSLDCNTLLPEGDLQSTCSFSDEDDSESQSTAKWIDFILIRDKKEKVKQEKVWIDEPRANIRGKRVRISDHNPIFSRILLKREENREE
jgi:endonuclease/exonuclease/phosphatase family metal-dependent hydrolase